MPRATDKAPHNAPPNTTADFLMAHREQILSRWIERVRSSIRAAKTELEPIIVNTFPALLENLAQALDPSFPRDLATEGSTVATEHGGERARITRYPPGEVIREFQLLRDVILETLSESPPFDRHETGIVVRSLDQAMTESLTAYFLVHQGIREQFVAILTHDLRNPLTAIKASADLILRRPDQPEQTAVLASRISENARRCDQMIQDLLDASKLHFGETPRFEVAKAELYSMLQESLTQLATIHGQRFTVQGKPITGYWNIDAFRRAFENLITNAVKYGDPTKPISIRLEEVRGRAVVSVRNEGSYIPPEEQESIFRSFMRSSSAQRGTKRGWGLGLAMVRGMAEGHGGSITIDSSPERGTTFIIDVPIDARPHVQHPVTPGSR